MAGLLKTARSFNELGELMKNARLHIRVIAGFQIQGRQPAEVGEVLEVSRSLATELISGGKAVQCDPPKVPEPVPEPKAKEPKVKP